MATTHLKSIKTLSELTSIKSLIPVKKIKHSLSLEQIIKNNLPYLQPEQYLGEYFRENNISYEITADKKQVIFTCPVFYKYVVGDIKEQGITESDLFKTYNCNNQLCTSVKLEYFSKINRTLVTVTNFYQVCNLPEIKPDTVSTGFIQFRSKDYIFISDNNKSYGEPIKKDMLLYDENKDIIGFTITCFDNSKISYLFN